MPIRHNHPTHIQPFHIPTYSILICLRQPIQIMAPMRANNRRSQSVTALRKDDIAWQRNDPLNANLLGLMRFPERDDVAAAHAFALLLLRLLDVCAAVAVLDLGRPFAHGGYDDPVFGAGIVDGG